jgi:hypothetical protein
LDYKLNRFFFSQNINQVNFKELLIKKKPKKKIFFFQNQLQHQMVVLENGGMVTIGNNQYLQPDYLSPLPTTLDAKKSPLALLAQTCSQIGVDSSNVKSIISLDKNSNKNNKMESTNKSISPSGLMQQHQNNNNNNSSLNNNNNINNNLNKTTEIKLAFKPYETNVLTKTTVEHHHHPHSQQHRPSSKDNNNSLSENNNNNSYNNNHSENNNVKENKVHSGRVPSRNKTESPSNNSENGKQSPVGSNADRKSINGSPSNLSQRGASPIIRSGLEVMQGKDSLSSLYKSGYGINPLTGGLCCPPGMEQHTNPAFRPPFAGAFSPHHAAMLAAVSQSQSPSSQSSAPPPGTFVSYARVKTPSGGEALVPVCKDPYCTGCPFSAHNQQMLMGSPCPAGCTQCEHQKYNFAAMAAMSAGLPPGHPYSQLNRPYACNWILGDTYCGKRFNTSDELLSHLRTHTSNLNDPAAIAALAAATAPSSLLSPLGQLFSPSALHRAYSNPPLSPMSASRYHPYGKPGQLPPSLSSFPGFNPGFPYYSPYALYGQRLGAAAVHP